MVELRARRPPTRSRRAHSAPPASYGAAALATAMTCGDASTTGASSPPGGSGRTCTCCAEYMPRRPVPRSFSGHDVHNTQPAATAAARVPGYVRMSPTGRVCRACHACRASRSASSTSSYVRKGRFLLVCDAADAKATAPPAPPPHAPRDKRHSAPPRVEVLLSRGAPNTPRHASISGAYAARFSYVVRHALKCGILAPMRGAWADSLGVTGTREDERWGSDQYWREALLGMPMNDVNKDGLPTQTTFVELIGPDGLAQFSLLLDAYVSGRPSRSAPPTPRERALRPSRRKTGSLGTARGPRRTSSRPSVRCRRAWSSPCCCTSRT